MTELRSVTQRRADVLAALERNQDAWLATASRSGRPHLVVVSTWWSGRQIVIATIGGSRTARNLDASGRARLGLGTPDDVILIDVEVAGSHPVEQADPELAAAFSGAVGWNPADEEGAWRYFSLTPVRAQAYRGYGELSGREVMRDSQWVR
jgi:hypothetical protein